MFWLYYVCTFSKNLTFTTLDVIIHASLKCWVNSSFRKNIPTISKNQNLTRYILSSLATTAFFLSIKKFSYEIISAFNKKREKCTSFWLVNQIFFFSKHCFYCFQVFVRPWNCICSIAYIIWLLSLEDENEVLRHNLCCWYWFQSGKGPWLDSILLSNYYLAFLKHRRKFKQFESSNG